jgi:quercetin dioxygenase-like cupin family protein
LTVVNARTGQEGYLGTWRADMGESKSSSGLQPSQTGVLAELIDYREQSVVSRVLAKSSGGTVTLFAFDEGQGLSEHTAPFDALVQVIEGSVSLTIGGAELLVGDGEIVLMPANVPHAVAAPERFKMLLTMLRETGGEG